MAELHKSELGAWLAEKRGRAATLAKLCGVAPSHVSDWAAGRSLVPVAHCPTVEEFTRGTIKCEQLQPTVRWHVLRGKRRQARPANDAHQQVRA